MQTFEVDPSSEEEACLVRFSTGKLNPEVIEKLEFKLHGEKHNKMANSQLKKLMLTTEVNEIPYCGRNFGSSNLFQTDTCDYYVGVRKHKSGKIKVMPAHLFQLDPQFTETASNPEETKEEEASSFRDKRYNLIKQFGSGKTKKIVNKRIREQLDKSMVSNTMESAVNKSLSEMQTPDGSAKQTPTSAGSESGSLILPPHDRHATNLEDFYKLDELLPPDIREELGSAASEFLECSASDISSWRTEKKFSETILQTLGNMPKKGTDSRVQSCQCLVYLHYLLAMYKMKAHDMRRKFSFLLPLDIEKEDRMDCQLAKVAKLRGDSNVPLPPSWNMKVRDYLMETFTLTCMDSGSRSRNSVPGRMKDLQMSYILVMCLKLNNYEIDLTGLSVDLKIPIQRLKIHALAVGCKVSSKNGQFRAVLTFPVKLLEPKQKAAKRKLY